MPLLPDLLYVVLFAVAFPLYGHFVFWPAFRRRSEADPARARRRLWAGTIVEMWLLVATGAALWLFYERPWTSLGFSVPEGWRQWASIGLGLLLVAYCGLSAATVARSAEARANVRTQFGTYANMLPHTRTDMVWFTGVSLTAGFCEEFLFRGYFIWVFAPWLGWWGAAMLSLLFFASAHSYQGWSGVLRTGLVGMIFTLVVAVTESLWPVMALHFLLDLGMGVIAWLALRDEPSTGGGSQSTAQHRHGK